MADFDRHLLSRWDMSNINPPDLGWKGNDNHGVGTGLVAATDVVEGIAGGKAVEFNGSDEKIVTIKNMGLSGDTTYALAAWFKAIAVGTKTILSLGGPAASAGAAMFTLATGEFGLATGGSRNKLSAAGAVVAGHWYHGVIVKTPGTVATTTILYLNGEDVTIAGGSGTIPNLLNSPTYIGVFTTAASGLNFDGSIADVRIYDAALTPMQVKELYNATRQGRA